jgi:hypothetical protein
MSQNSRVFDALNPGSKEARTEQYRIAWEALGSEAYSPSDRQHARCWLTYRAFDGEVTFADWQKHVMAATIPHANASLQARWSISQATAELYLGIMQDETLAWTAFSRLRCLVAEGALLDWPAGALCTIRASCLHVYHRYLAGESIHREVQSIMHEWAAQFQRYATPTHPLRWCEVMDAVPVLKALAFIAEKEGAVKISGAFGNHPAKAINHASALPWARCMYRLGAGNPKALWVLPNPNEGRLVDQYRQIHATKRYGPGGLKPEWKAVYERLTANVPVRSVIDYGCGRSKDIKELWPDAHHTFYDPAIPGIDKLPDGTFSLGYCTQVMEHIPEEEVAGTLAKMKALSPWWVLTIHTKPANQILPTGENAHCTQKNSGWWAIEFAKVFGTVHTEPMSEACFYLTTIPQKTA